MKIGKEKKEHPGKFRGRFSKDGGLDFGDFTKIRLKSFMKENPGMPFELQPIYAESTRQRAWFEGALIPLITFYQENMDHREPRDVKRVREWVKTEFNGELVAVGGKTHKVASTTSQRLNLGLLERVVDWLEANYAPPAEALNPKDWKRWHDEVFPYGGPENYIDYLVEKKIL